MTLFNVMPIPPPPSQALISTVDPRPIVRAAARATFGRTEGRPVMDGERVIGSIFETPDATTCYLHELVSPNLHTSGGAQTTHIFETIKRVLQAEGMAFGHLVRTWFYLDGILDWYDEFNRARTPFLEAHGAFEALMPASTGIGIANRFGAAVVAGAFAIKPKGPQGARVREVASPMQCPAVAYKSAFSRAVEVERADRRELYISGTASIEPGGKTAHAGDTRAQIGLTMEVVEALLHSRGMHWGQCTRAIAYVKAADDAPLFADYLREHRLEGLPLTWMHADVCRDDLLFELELDAATERR